MKSGKGWRHAAWGFRAYSEEIDPDFDEDWFGAHPGNLLAKEIPLSEQERLARLERYLERKRRRLALLFRPLLWKDGKKLKLIKLGKYKFTARETSEYAVQYEYDRHVREYRYPYMQHVMDYYDHRVRVREEHKALILKEEAKRRGQYLLYLRDAPDDHLDYARWCVRGLLSP